MKQNLFTNLPSKVEEYYSLTNYKSYCDEMEMEYNESDYPDWVAEMCEMDWSDFCCNMESSEYLDYRCVIKGTLGLWDGKHDIEPVEMDSFINAIYKCLGECDYMEIECDEDGIYVSATHHDGTNVFTITLRDEDGRDVKIKDGKLF